MPELSGRGPCGSRGWKTRPSASARGHPGHLRSPWRRACHRARGAGRGAAARTRRLPQPPPQRPACAPARRAQTAGSRPAHCSRRTHRSGDCPRAGAGAGAGAAAGAAGACPAHGPGPRRCSGKGEATLDPAARAPPSARPVSPARPAIGRARRAPPSPRPGWPRAPVRAPPGGVGSSPPRAVPALAAGAGQAACGAGCAERRAPWYVPREARALPGAGGLAGR